MGVMAYIANKIGVTPFSLFWSSVFTGSAILPIDSRPRVLTHSDAQVKVFAKADIPLRQDDVAWKLSLHPPKHQQMHHYLQL